MLNSKQFDAFITESENVEDASISLVFTLEMIRDMFGDDYEHFVVELARLRELNECSFEYLPNVRAVAITFPNKKTFLAFICRYPEVIRGHY